MQYRLAQVVYTLTQFSTVKSVVFQIEGQTVTVFGGEGIVLDGPVGRADFDDQLPSIFVDRPAYGAALGNPAARRRQRERLRGHLPGRPDRRERARRSSTTRSWRRAAPAAGAPSMSSLGYTVTKAQWGTLRAYDLVGQGRHARGHPRLPGLAHAKGLKSTDLTRTALAIARAVLRFQ